MNKNISKVWTFASDSNPNTKYETLQYVDGTTSCNCMGWTRRVDASGRRSCKHTRFVDMGIADDHCTASHDYLNQTQEPQPQRKEQIQYGKSHFHQTPKLGHRKITV